MWRWTLVEILKLGLVNILSLILVEMLMFGWDIKVDAWSRFWRWNLIKICVWACDMNSTLGSVVPLAKFNFSSFLPFAFLFFKYLYAYLLSPLVSYLLNTSVTCSSDKFLQMPMNSWELQKFWNIFVNCLVNNFGSFFFMFRLRVEKIISFNLKYEWDIFSLRPRDKNL